MPEVNSLETRLEALLAEVKTYNSKPTKASSARIRKALGELKKDVTLIRAKLVNADKNGY